MSYFNDDNETVRQTLERVMREKGMWKEPEVMHTEIGDFHFYNDNNNNASTSGSNTADISGQPTYTNNTVGQPSSYFQNNNLSNSTYGGLNTGSGAGYNQPPTPNTFVTQQNQSPTPWNNSNNQNIGSTTTTLSDYSQTSNGGYNSTQAQQRAQELQTQRNRENEWLMDGMDTIYGMNRAINGMTFGGLDWLGNKLGYDTQMNNYLQLKTPQERELAQTAGNIAQWGGNAVAGGALAKAGLNQANMAYNKFTQWNSKRNLTNQLQRGNNFKDIYMGKIDKDKLSTLNSVRRSEGAEFIPSRKVNIPKDRVQHIYEERIIGDGYTPKEAADTIYDAVFNPKSKIQASRYKTLQKFDSPTPNRAIVGKIRDGDSIFIKTGYRK